MSGVRVKPLVWRGKNGCFRGDSADGTCYAANEISPARWMLDRHGIGASVVIGNDFATLAKAAAAAQTDYDARILSAIDTTALDAERDELRALVEEMRANRQEIAAEVKQLACLVQETLRLSEEERRLREAKQAEAAAEIARLTEERDRLRVALAPFASLAQAYDPPEGDDDQYCWVVELSPTLGDLRRARAALSPKPEGE